MADFTVSGRNYYFCPRKLFFTYCTEGDARMFLAVKKASKGRKRNAEVTVECTNVTFHGDGNFFGCIFEVEVLLNLNGVFL